MSFLSWFAKNAESYNKGLLSLMSGGGVWIVVVDMINGILCWLMAIMANITSTMSELYSKSFELFRFMYSEKVVSLFQGWIQYLWIPIAVGLFILGFNMINGEDSIDTKKSMSKKYLQNVVILLVALVGFPMIFMGVNESTTMVWYDTSQSGKGANGNDVANQTNAGIADILIAKDSNGQNALIAANEEFANSGSSNFFSANKVQSIISQNIYDMEYIFIQTAQNQSNLKFTDSWSDYLTKGTIKKNAFKDGDDVASVLSDSNSYFKVSDLDNYSLKLDTVKTPNDIINNKDDNVNYDKAYIDRDTNVADYNGSDAKSTANYLFGYQHSVQDVNINGKTYHFISNLGSNTSGNILAMFGWDSTTIRRYHIEYGVMFIELLSLAIIFCVSALKIVKNVFSITFGQLLAVFTAAADLTGGQKAREVMKSVFNIVFSTLFITILVQLYMVFVEIVNSAFPTNAWVRCLLALFLAIACINGSKITERALGIDSSLKGEYGSMGAANRWTRQPRIYARMAAIGATVGGLKLANIGVSKGAKGVSYAKGKAASAKAQNAAGYVAKGKIGKNSTNAGKTKGVRGSSAFSPVTNKNGVANSNRSNGVKVSNNAQASQSRLINDSLNKQTQSANLKGKDIASARQGVANEYRGNILNSAAAEKFAEKGKSKEQLLSDMYERRGISPEKSKELADRVLNKEDSFASVADYHGRDNLKNLYEKNGIDPVTAEKFAAQDIAEGISPIARSKDELANTFASRGLEADKAEKLAGKISDDGNLYREQIANSYMAAGIMEDKANIMAQQDLNANPYEIKPRNDRDILSSTYESAGFNSQEASRLADRDIADGAFNAKLNSFEDSISNRADTLMNSSAQNFDTVGDAYRAAAQEHFEAMGFNRYDSSRYADSLGTKVCTEDYQDSIRSAALQYQTAENSRIDALIAEERSKPPKERNYDVLNTPRVSDREAVEYALQNDVGARSAGYAYDKQNYETRYQSYERYNPNSSPSGIPLDTSFRAEINSAVDTILANGSLKEGAVRGRAVEAKRAKAAEPYKYSSVFTDVISSERNSRDYKQAAKYGFDTEEAKYTRRKRR